MFIFPFTKLLPKDDSKILINFSSSSEKDCIKSFLTSFTQSKKYLAFKGSVFHESARLSSGLSGFWIFHLPFSFFITFLFWYVELKTYSDNVCCLEYTSNSLATNSNKSNTPIEAGADSAILAVIVVIIAEIGL